MNQKIRTIVGEVIADNSTYMDSGLVIEDFTKLADDITEKFTPLLREAFAKGAASREKSLKKHGRLRGPK